MFDHVTIRVRDRAAAERFYAGVLRTLDAEVTYSDDWFVEWSDFSLMEATDAKPVTRDLHVGFVAPCRAQVDEFWRVGTANGSIDAGAPGERPQYKPDYYGAFLLDPDGNNIEFLYRDPSVR